MANIGKLKKQAKNDKVNKRQWCLLRRKQKKELEMQQEQEREVEEREAAAKKSDVLPRDPRVLRKVNRDCTHMGPANCTEIVFADETKEYIKIETFDKDLKITEKAEGLENERVVTTCWDPIDEPGKWSKQGYFRNIYTVEDDDAA